MEKNVGSVNLEELKAAREALDKERGLETDPDMYKNYDPEKHKAEKEQAMESSEELSVDDSLSGDSEEIISDIENVNNDEELLIDDSESSRVENIDLTSENNVIVDDVQSESANQEDNKINFNIYDTFSDFEIKNENPAIENNAEKQDGESSEILEIESNFGSENNLGDDSQDEASIDDFLSELDNILSKDSNDETDEILDEKENEEEPVLDAEINNQLSDLNEEAVVENVDSLKEDGSVDIENGLDTEETEKSEFLDKNNQLNEVKAEEKQDSSYDAEVLTDFSKLSEMFDEMQDVDLISDEEPETDKIEEKEETAVENADSSKEDDLIDVGGYEKIEAFNFVDVMSSEEFKEVDNLSYLLGKDSEGKFVYGNLSDTCGTVVFTKNDESVKSNFNSMILSLILKNSPETMQFVICDPMFNSEFDVYKKSSYMYFNRVAKNNREIVDSMFELSKELEKRYNDLVYSGVKSISAYNIQAEERGAKQMPYIVLFINNYAKMMQFLDAEKINTCLYNILKFGRIVGVYAIVASTSDIEKGEINYNLPTRICYKTEDEYDSVASIGSGGAEKLKDEQDFLYSTIYDDEVKHLKCATLSLQEIEVIIENLEN